MHSTVWAILNNEKYLGLSIHEINEYVDDGPIISQYVIEYKDETACEIIELCNEYVRINLGSIIESYLEGTIKAVKQSYHEATWVCKRNLDDCFVDFDWSVDFMRRFFKALVLPYPLPRLKIKNELYEITSAEFLEREYYMTTAEL